MSHAIGRGALPGLTALPLGPLPTAESLPVAPVRSGGFAPDTLSLSPALTVAPPPPPAAPAPAGPPMLGPMPWLVQVPRSRASENAIEVKILQHMLAHAGFDPGPIDGWFGPVTERAVRAFQAAKGLVVDGEAGTQTWAALGLEGLPRQAAAAPSAPSAANPAPVGGAFPPLPAPDSEQAARMIGVAFQFLGQPYDKGSKSKQSRSTDYYHGVGPVECSGLIGQAVLGAGLTWADGSPLKGKVLSYTLTLRDNLPPISREELKPGDLVFFNSSLGPWRHVGIYIGDNKMIHSGMKGVEVRDLANYSLDEAGYRRIIGAPKPPAA
ncbi:MAG: peptidoglycan-binding protein [Candidatus Sericytochromatia bacterium]|nr:peptidoglycan-binding protein [Candidatus Sericytochromatia bacterium]